VAATNERIESGPAAVPAAPPRRAEAGPPLPAASILALQRTAGNRAVTAHIARDAAPKLRTALDSKLVVTPAGSGYAASLQLGGDGEPASVAIATYQPKGDTPLKRLPVYLEDVVTGSEAVVNIRYDPAAADVQAKFETQDVHGVKVTVRLLPGTAESLTVASAPAAHQVGSDGANVDGKETVQTHSGASATDKIMGSIASAEGGFASTEGSDAGVLTWGQGQWTVTAGELQKVLAFIKDRRRDLFDRYWGRADLDVQGSDFVHDGKRWGPAKRTMMELFRPNVETITAWANLFGQAGMDPQIQRLQREYLRGEVHEVLAKPVGGHTPESVLDTRGQAYYYSMDKNLPSAARTLFLQALKEAALPDGGQVSDAQKTQVSDALGELFRNSSVVAFDNRKHHIIAFWGEGGRKRGVDQADAAIAAGGDATWTVAQWTRQRERMQARQSRYTKTRADIDKAIAHQEIEPDVPADVDVAAAPAAAAPAPHAPPAGPAIGEEIHHLVDDAKLVLELAATGTGLKELRIAGSVGRGGANQRHDVAAVCARMLGVGFPPGTSLTELGATIARYQAEIVRMPHPDGRIDPGGRTLAALRGANHAPAPAAAPAPAGHAPAPPPPPAQAPPPIAAPAGPRPAVADSELEQLVAASHNPAVQAAAAELAQLEKQFAGLHHNDGNEESGAGRDELVAGFRSLRAQVALLDPALQPHFFRAMNAISPYYYQGLNIILEFDRKNKVTGKLEHVWNTCNITSLSMTLEALGRSAADYKHPDLIPPIAEVFRKDIAGKATDRASGKLGSTVAGLRLPDFVAMAAVAWQMGYKTGDEKAILKGGNDAFSAVPSAHAIETLARDFRVPARRGALTLNASGRADATPKALDEYGETHWKKADIQAIGETAGHTPRQAGKLSDADIERKVPLERYKQSVRAQIGPELDAGRQVVVGQWHHFVRLQAVDDEFVTKDDPGRHTGANEKATWEEARAMGLFLNWIVIG
jgi:hypothetical protein